MSFSQQFDVLIIGAGAAGLSLALRLPAHLRIGLLAKQALKEGNTLYAQGGISAVLDEKDSVDAHVADTLDAGAGLCDEDIVRMVVERGPANIDWLLRQGVQFTEYKDKGYHLTREGGHTHRRVVHAADATGRAVELTLEQQVRDAANITLFEFHHGIDLIRSDRLGLGGPRRCVGLYAYDARNEQVRTLLSKTLVLATGGAAKAYLYTSNPDVATGDGIAMAWRAGCRVANMEFIQFHPTCLYHPKAKSFLVSEALRGEGAHLLLPDGTRFMSDYDERAELAPRDIVARAIDNEMKRLGLEHVLLDISHQPANFVREHFPTIYQRCLAYGIDITREAIPVVPAAHYTCGGIKVNAKAESDLLGLYAVGEVAYTGLHGANRMASNSLLECLVFGEITAAEIATSPLLDYDTAREVPDWDESRAQVSNEAVVIRHDWQELRRFMWNYVGIVRSNKRLQRASNRIELLQREVLDYYHRTRINGDLLELRNLVQVAGLIIVSASLRKESRGLHYTQDFPDTDNSQRRPTVLIPENYVPRASS